MFTWKTSLGIKIKLFKIGITNCYLIKTNNINLLVDSGPKRFSKKIISLLKANLLEGEALNYLFLTHSHFDHSQNVKLIFDHYNPQIIVHKTEVDCAKKGYTPIPDGTFPITKLISNLGRRFTPQIAEYEPIVPNISIDSEYLINDLPELKIIETPGHTTGSMSLIIDNEIAFVGDTMFGHFRKTILTPFGNDIPGMYHSWEKLLATGCRLFLPAHGKAIKKEKLEQEIKRVLLKE